MGNRVTQKPITTISGRYYAGETAQTAKKKGNYKKTVGIDFRDIDKNKDGKLSAAEICDARDREVQRFKKRTAVTVSGAAIAAGGVATGVGAFAALAGGAMMAGAITGDLADGTNGKTYKEMQAEQAKTNAYRNTHHLNVKM